MKRDVRHITPWLTLTAGVGAWLCLAIGATLAYVNRDASPGPDTTHLIGYSVMGIILSAFALGTKAAITESTRPRMRKIADRMGLAYIILAFLWISVIFLLWAWNGFFHSNLWLQSTPNGATELRR